MISEEQRARIRRLFFAEHWKVGTICTELGLHRDTVDLALEPKRFANSRRPSSASAAPSMPSERFASAARPRAARTRVSHVAVLIHAR